MTMLWLVPLAVFPLSAFAADPAVLVTVNGVPVRRSEVADRAFQQHGPAILQAMVDEILISQAAQAMKMKPDTKEVVARLKRIRSQFPDEATLQQRLAATGQSLEGVRSQLDEQVKREQMVVKAKGLSVGDAEMKDFFDANKERLGTPEAVRVRHIVVGTQKEANDFLVAVRAGADFARLASQVSLDNATKDKGGDLGFVSRGMLLPEIEKLVFSLKAGEASGPLQSAAGFHLFKAEEVRAATPAVFKNVQSDLKAALLADKITKAWPGFLQELRGKAKIEAPATAAR